MVGFVNIRNFLADRINTTGIQPAYSMKAIFTDQNGRILAENVTHLGHHPEHELHAGVLFVLAQLKHWVNLYNSIGDVYLQIKTTSAGAKSGKTLAIGKETIYAALEDLRTIHFGINCEKIHREIDSLISCVPLPTCGYNFSQFADRLNKIKGPCELLIFSDGHSVPIYRNAMPDGRAGAFFFLFAFELIVVMSTFRFAVKFTTETGEKRTIMSLKYASCGEKSAYSQFRRDVELWIRSKRS